MDSTASNTVLVSPSPDHLAIGRCPHCMTMVYEQRPDDPILGQCVVCKEPVHHHDKDGYRSWKEYEPVTRYLIAHQRCL